MSRGHVTRRCLLSAVRLCRQKRNGGATLAVKFSRGQRGSWHQHQPSRASAPRIDLSNRRQMSGRAERRWCDDTEPLQPLLLFICSRQRDAATAGVVSGPSYPRHSYDPFCAVTGYTVVTLPIIAFLPQPAPTQPQPRPRAHGDTGTISCHHCKLQTSPSPAHAACCAAGSQNLS